MSFRIQWRQSKITVLITKLARPRPALWRQHGHLSSEPLAQSAPVHLWAYASGSPAWSSLGVHHGFLPPHRHHPTSLPGYGYHVRRSRKFSKISWILYVVGWMLVSPQNEQLSPGPWCNGDLQAEPLGGQLACLRVWGQELHAGISVPTGRGTESSISRSMRSGKAMWTYKEKVAVSQDVGPHQTSNTCILTLDFPVSRTVRNKFLLFKPPGLWYFAEPAQDTSIRFYIALCNFKRGNKRA